jgi:signal peptidase II
LIDASPEPARPRNGLRPLYFYIIVGLVFVCDQASKAMIQRNMIFGEYREIFGSNFMLTLTKNTGGAWGLAPSWNSLFVAFAAVAIVALLYAYHRVARGDLLVGSAFALALGGALGNLLDRLRYGFVVDFFDVRIIKWPIFNVADSAISLGIVLLLIHYIGSIRAESASRVSMSPEPPLAADELENTARPG